MRLPRQTADIARFDSWASVRARTADTPVAHLPEPVLGSLADIPALSRADRAEFVDDVVGEVHDALAVRARCLAATGLPLRP